MLVRSGNLAALIVLSWSAVGQADEHAAVAPYLAKDVSSVVYFDLDKVDLPAIVGELKQLNLIAEPHLGEANKQTAAIQAKLDELTELGARRAYLLVRVSDFFDGPTLVVEVAEEGQAKAVVDWLARWAEKADALGDAAAYVPRTFIADGKAVVGAVTPERLAKVSAKREGPPRREAIEALAALDGVDAGWVAFGDADSRRVVREMFPQFPAPFTEIDGKLLADGLEWIALTLKLPPDPTLTFAVKAAEQDTATMLENSIGKGLMMAKGLLVADKINGPPVHKERAEALLPLLAKLAPLSEDARLSITFGDDVEERAVLQDYLPKVVEGAQAKSHRTARLQKFKHILLAMHTHASSIGHGRFPAAASYDGEGRPLLSWRVHLLQHTGDVELYKKFRLDEPWDSEHNRTLIAEMPAMYADPDPRVREKLEPGETTFVVPFGKGMAFEGREGMALQSITDGTSNTILAVEVVPEKAVVWTKPADWEVDLDDPADGVARTDRAIFTAGFADGSVQMLPHDDAEALKRQLTRAAKD